MKIDIWEVIDAEMKIRVDAHKENRQEQFITLEEPLELHRAISTCKEDRILVECVSMWINNMIHHGYSEEAMVHQIEELEELGQDIVFVINDVSCSVVSENKLVRKFVDINGRISQLLASKCEEVYHTTAGISIKIK